MNNRISSFGFAMIGGAAVFVSGMAVDLALLGHERPKVVAFLIANCVAGLIAIITGLAFQLRQEERHFRFATEKAATMAELNHHVRNAVFPLVLAVQRSQDPESNRLANEAMSRLDIALRDAAVDAYSGKIRYADEVSDRIAAWTSPESRTSRGPSTSSGRLWGARLMPHGAGVAEEPQSETAA